MYKVLRHKQYINLLNYLTRTSFANTYYYSRGSCSCFMRVFTAKWHSTQNLSKAIINVNNKVYVGFAQLGNVRFFASDIFRFLETILSYINCIMVLHIQGYNKLFFKRLTIWNYPSLSILFFFIVFLGIIEYMCHLKWNETPEGRENSHICSFSYTA